MRTTESRKNADTAIAEIAWLSKQKPAQEFSSLMHHVNISGLRRCFNKLDGKRATGVDQVTKEEYGEGLEEKLQNLIKRMKSMSYRPKAVRQVLIPKEGKGNATRALGISSFEDKLVQKRMQEILESIYEGIFLDCSHGFRPERSCHSAVKELHNHLHQEEVEVVIDVDLANFFGSIDHNVLMKMLSIKIKDRKFMRYISRMLKAGVLAEGEMIVSDEGVPQGSCCSPILSNIVAHYVIDEWLEETVKPRMAGKIKVIRYADDLVICCRYGKDAKRIKQALGKRLDKYKLSLNEEKTKMVLFSKRKTRLGIKQGTFGFLGFTFYLGRSRKGRIIPKLKTCGQRYRAKLVKVKLWVRGIRNKKRIESIWKEFCSKLRGHIRYYAVSFNMKAVERFLDQAKKTMFKWLNRRSQRKTMSWEKFELFTRKNPLPKAKVCHRLY